MIKTKDVEKSEELFLHYKDGKRDNWREKVDSDRKVKINSWEEAHQRILENMGQMAVPINEILPAIDLIVAQLTENDPRFKAIGREKSDYKVAAYISALYQWIWEKSKGRSKIDKFVRDVIEIGIGGLFVYIDPFEDNGRGEIKITDINCPNELYISPQCEEMDASDSPHLLYSKIISEETVSTKYPTINLTDAEQMSEVEGTNRLSDQGQILYPDLPANVKYYRLIDRYTKIKIKRFHVYDPVSGYDNVFENEQDFIEWANEPALIVVNMGKETAVTDEEQIKFYMIIKEQYGEVYHKVYNQEGGIELAPGVEFEDNAVIGSTTEIQEVTKGQLINDGIIKLDKPLVDRIKRVFSIGGVEVVNEVLPIRDYPIVTCMLHHDRTPFPMGDIRITASLQKQLDKVDNLIMTYNQNITNLKILVQKGSGQAQQIMERLGKAGTDVIEINYESDKPPIPLQYPQMGNSIYQHRENIIRQIQRIIGSYSFQDGDAASAPRTLGGTDRIDEFMQRRSAYKKRKIEATLDQVAKVIAQYIPYTYTEEKQIRIMLPNHAEPQEIIFNQPEMKDNQIRLINDITTHEFDVQIISGSMLPSNKAQERQELFQYWQAGLFKDNRAIIEKLDFENIDEILQREDQLAKAEQAIGQLQETIKDLQGQLQTKTREVIQANEKVEVEKTKTKLGQLENKAESAVLLGKERISDEIKKVKEKNNGKAN